MRFGYGSTNPNVLRSSHSSVGIECAFGYGSTNPNVLRSYRISVGIECALVTVQRIQTFSEVLVEVWESSALWLWFKESKHSQKLSYKCGNRVRFGYGSKNPNILRSSSRSVEIECALVTVQRIQTSSEVPVEVWESSALWLRFNESKRPQKFSQQCGNRVRFGYGSTKPSDLRSFRRNVGIECALVTVQRSQTSSEVFVEVWESSARVLGHVAACVTNALGQSRRSTTEHTNLLHL